MSSFRFTARNERGHIIRGEREAADHAELTHELARMGLTLLEATSPDMQPPSLRQRLRGKRLSLKDRLTLATQLHLYFRMGMPVPELLDAVGTVADSPALREALARVRTHAQQGASLGEAVATEEAVIGRFLVSLIRVGEQSGTLAGLMEHAAQHLRQMQTIRAEMRQKLRSPITTLVLTTLALTIFMPSLLGKLVVVGLLVVPILLYRRSDAFATQVDAALLRVPVLGPLFYAYEMMQFTPAFKLACMAGLPVAEGLPLSAMVVGNRALRRDLLQMADFVQRGSTLSQAARQTGDFPAEMLNALRASEQSGQFEHAMEQLYHFYSRALDDRFAMLNEWLRLAILLLSGAAVLGLAQATGRL